MVLEAITEFYFDVLTFVFSPILGLDPLLAESIIAVFLVFTTTLFYKYLVNQDEMKRLRDQQKELSSRAKELQKTDPEKSNKIMGEVLKLTNKQMKMNMKPMMAALVMFVLFFPWLRLTFLESVYIALPFTIPLFGAELGWLGWYIVLSIPLSMLIRKAMGVK